MPYIVDFTEVSTRGLETSPFAQALAGLRANEARYHWNKYQHRFTVVPAGDSQDTLDYVNHILKTERDLEFSATPLETSWFEVGEYQAAYVFYEEGWSLNVMYASNNPKRRAVGFKLAEGAPIPPELEGRFKFASMRSKLGGAIRGSYFIIKGTYGPMTPRLTPADVLPPAR